LLILKAVAQRPIDLADIDAIWQAHPRLDQRRIRQTVAELAAILECPEIVTQLETLLQNETKRRRKG
jgi:hypothetical protein